MIFTIYTQHTCPYCEQAKNLIKHKGHTYVELVLNVGQPQKPGFTYVPVQHLKDKVPHAKTIPQIFVGKYHVGGFAELQGYLRYDKDAEN